MLAQLQTAWLTRIMMLLMMLSAAGPKKGQTMPSAVWVVSTQTKLVAAAAGFFSTASFLATCTAMSMVTEQACLKLPNIDHSAAALQLGEEMHTPCRLQHWVHLPACSQHILT